MASYQYSPLDKDSRQIRLMTLLPRNCGIEIQVLLEIVTSGIGTELRYEALSYTWGSAENTTSIRVKAGGLTGSLVSTILSGSAKKSWSFIKKFEIQDKSLTVTRNLEVALEHLRYDNEPRRLWIDAICINQQDMEERSNQVQRMADIYRFADRTIIWLGPEANSSTLAVQTLKDLGSKVTADWENLECIPITKDAHEASYLANTYAHLPFNYEQWMSISAFIERPWFDRLWIWQEVRLARHAEVVCGSDTIMWNHLRAAILCLYLHPKAYILP